MQTAAPAQPKTEPALDDDQTAARALLLAEYSSLREEILKRTELEYQLIALALIAPGTLLTIAGQTKQAALVLLYPLFAFFLATAWANNDRAVRQIAEYIRTRIEAKVGRMGWEGVMEQVRTRRAVKSLNFLAARGVFLSTEVLTIIAGLLLAPVKATPLAAVVGLTLPNFGALTNALIVFAALMVVATFLALRKPAIVRLPVEA